MLKSPNYVWSHVVHNLNSFKGLYRGLYRGILKGFLRGVLGVFTIAHVVPLRLCSCSIQEAAEAKASPTVARCLRIIEQALGEGMHV